jgi:SAM-dependent methyltransferase
MPLKNNMGSYYSKEEIEFLNEINQYLPKNVDWKEGARKYLSNLLKDNPHAERYHFTKPFIGGPDFASFFEEMNKFLNLLQKLNLPQKSLILDVGTGPGWTAHFLGKLGHRVLGIDISQELLDIAERRIQSDHFPPYEDTPFDVKFRLHDIESDPIETDEPFDVAIFESTLHHLYDPISALKHIGLSLKKTGVVAILEGAAPDRGSLWNHKFHELMDKYHTLERPYSKQQMEKLLSLTNFKWFTFYSSINGFFEQGKEIKRDIKASIEMGKNYNYVIASQDEQTIRLLNRNSNTTVHLEDYFDVEERGLLKFMKRIFNLIPENVKYKRRSVRYAKFLRDQYIEILKREPDREGFEFFLSKLNSGELRAKEIRTIFENSEEYKTKNGRGAKK